MNEKAENLVVLVNNTYCQRALNLHQLETAEQNFVKHRNFLHLMQKRLKKLGVQEGGVFLKQQRIDAVISIKKILVSLAKVEFFSQILRVFDDKTGEDFGPFFVGLLGELVLIIDIIPLSLYVEQYIH